MKKNHSLEFEKVYLENFKYVYNYIYMTILHKETAEDICSKAFLNAYTHFDSYNPSLASARVWLCRIAKNCLLDHMKSKFVSTTDFPEELPEVATQDSDPISRRAVNQELERLFAMLSEEDRQIISMRFYLDMQIKEIAEVMKSSPNTLSHRITRILDKLRKAEEKSGNSLSDFLDS